MERYLSTGVAVVLSCVGQLWEGPAGSGENHQIASSDTSEWYVPCNDSSDIESATCPFGYQRCHRYQRSEDDLEQENTTEEKKVEAHKLQEPKC